MGGITMKTSQELAADGIYTYPGTVPAPQERKANQSRLYFVEVNEMGSGSSASIFVVLADNLSIARQKASRIYGQRTAVHSVHFVPGA